MTLFQVERMSQPHHDVTPPCPGAMRQANAWVIEIATIDELLQLCEKVDRSRLIIDVEPNRIVIEDDSHYWSELIL